MKKINDTTKRVIVLGVLSGMRTNAGLLCTSMLIGKQPGIYFEPDRLVRFFGNKKSLVSLSVSAVGEMIVDKLPMTPARTNFGGLTGRIVSGAVSGAAICKASGKKGSYGAIIGGIAALASTFTFYYLRRNLCRATKIPDPYLGAAEDALAITIGLALVNSEKTLF